MGLLTLLYGPAPIDLLKSADHTELLRTICVRTPSPESVFPLINALLTELVPDAPYCELPPRLVPPAERKTEFLSKGFPFDNNDSLEVRVDFWLVSISSSAFLSESFSFSADV